MEEQEDAFYKRVRDAYHALAASEPHRFRLIDGSAGADAVEQEIWNIVLAHV